jgi:hypothetical protein
MSKRNQIANVGEQADMPKAGAATAVDPAPALPDNFARLMEADFRASTSLAVQDAQRQGITSFGRDAQGRLVALSPDGTTALVDLAHLAGPSTHEA